MTRMGCRCRVALATSAGLFAVVAAVTPVLASVKHPSWHPVPTAVGAGAMPAGSAVAVDMRVSETGGVTRLVVDLSDRVGVEAALRERPARVVIDLPEVNFQVDPAVGKLDQRSVGLIRAFRFGLFAPGRSRIVIDLTGPAALRRVDVSSIAGGNASRLTVELAPSDPAAFRAAASPMAARHPLPSPAPVPVSTLANDAPAASLTTTRPGSDGRPVIVIDPGHGGIDPGASGVSGAVEKDVVLQFSAALATRLSAGDRYRVVMTRRDDSFVSLGDRVRIARDADAALLISVHADTLSDGSVTGATVYTASDQASDAEAARLATTENQADAAAGLDEAPKAADVSDILFDLTRRETRTYAHQFQRTLTGYWAKIARLNHNPERSAGFKVLQAPDVPSVLLELGYLSSGEDARALRSPDWRGKAVDGVASAIESFFAVRANPSPASGTSAIAGAAAMR